MRGPRHRGIKDSREILQERSDGRQFLPDGGEFPSRFIRPLLCRPHRVLELLWAWRVGTDLILYTGSDKTHKLEGICDPGHCRP